jgi:hypothetical protein
MHINADTDVPLRATLQCTNNKMALALCYVIFFSDRKLTPKNAAYSDTVHSVTLWILITLYALFTGHIS